MNKRVNLASLTLLTALINGPVQALTFSSSGHIDLEARFFTDTPAYPGQSDDHLNLSLSIAPELFWRWNNDRDSLLFKPYLRIDQHDDERTHGDIRELLWNHAGENWELRLGLGKVFWGVTEFQHLVDVINQTDQVEDIDGEDKLGQPMINLSYVFDWGIVDWFVLPGFREQSAPGRKGRLRSPWLIDTDQARYQARNEQRHVDVALRWSHSVSDYDWGVHLFRGTQRTPELVPLISADAHYLQPYYPLMTQLGVDFQATLDSWLWKAEVIYRATDRDNYWASQTGLEYTFYGIAASAADLGLLVEYGWDQRGSKANALFQNDLSLGLRLSLNDSNSSELLAGILYDLDHHSYSVQLEASRRLNPGWKISLDLRLFHADDYQDPLTALDQDSHIQVTLQRYF